MEEKRVMINNTFNQWMPIWVDNMLEARDMPLHDISEMQFQLTANLKRITFYGTGPSYNPGCFDVEEFSIVNQSSLLRLTRDVPSAPDLCVVTDANPNILNMLEDAAAQGNHPMLAVATLAYPPIHELFNAYAFHHPYVRGIPILDLLFDKLCPRSITTSIVQVGNSMNVAMLLAAQLVELGILPKVSFHLNGVDFAYEDGMSSPEFKLYAEDNKTIVTMLKANGYTVTKEPGPGPLNQWIEEV